jgi:hypothetical protein
MNIRSGLLHAELKQSRKVHGSNLLGREKGSESGAREKEYNG